MNLETLFTKDYDDIGLDKRNYKETFYSLMGDNGFDFTDIDNESKLPKSLLPVIANETEAFNMFNNVLSKLYKNKQIDIIDAVAFLVNDYLDASVVLKCLDEMNFLVLKNELQEKYGIKQEVEEDENLSIMDFLG